MSEFEKIMNEEEDSEENVYIDEKEAGFEEDLFMDDDLKKLNNKKERDDDDDDFYQDDNEKEEVQQKLDKKIGEEIKKEDSKDLHRKEEPKVLIKKEEKPIIIPKKEEVEKKSNSKKVEKKVEKKILKKEEKKTPHIKKEEVKKTIKKKPKKMKKANKKNYFWPVFLSLIGIAIILWAIFYIQGSNSDGEVVAVVNGQEITIEELNKEYEFFFLLGGLPEEYKDVVTKEYFLNNSLVSGVLLVQEAETEGITISIIEAEEVLVENLAYAGLAENEFKDLLKERGLTYEDAKEYFQKQLISFEVLNQTVFKDLYVGESQILESYNENKELFDEQGYTFEEVKKDIESTLLAQMQREVAELFMDTLKVNANIEILYGKEETINWEDIEITSDAEITTFTATKDFLCTENGKPLVILFSTSSCPHCVWVGATFDKVVANYDNIAAYHWQLDSGDNLLTLEKENTLPTEHIEILQKYDSKGYVPAFVIGCKYYRIGNGHEAEGSLDAEEAELKAVIETLT